MVKPLTRLCSVLGWLHKEVQSSNKMSSLKMKKRWFVLTNTALDYYKSSERTAAKLGTLVLNSLCSVVQPDERVFKDTGKRKKEVMSRFPCVEFPEEELVQECDGGSC